MQVSPQTLNSEVLEDIVQALSINSDSSARRYREMIFAESVENTLENIPCENRDEFVSIALEYGYQPLSYQQENHLPANDELHR